MPLRWLLFLLLVNLQATAQHYTPIDSLGAVKFEIKNFGLSVEGTFKGLQGDIVINPNDPAKSYINIQLDANTIDTGIGLRNKHLKKEDYLFTEKFPLITFKSTRFLPGENGLPNQIIGKLTLKGVSREVTIPFTITGTYIKTFKGEFTINRQLFNVGGKSVGMADEVLIILNVSVKSSS